MWLHVDWHGTNIYEKLANFILLVGHAVLLDHPENKDREIRNVYAASYPKRLKSRTAPKGQMQT
jgi:hypothetical protein